MGGLAGPSESSDEAALAQRAAAGDGEAFATLYERYESRVYNLCYRIVGSQDDAADATQEAFLGVLRRLPKLEGRDLAFGSYVFTSARNACYDLIERQRRTQPSDEIAEGATPVGGGVGGGGIGFDPGDPEDDPERNVLQEARNEEIRAANLELPERQREVLALRELEGLSYDEIAELMDMNRNSVAQLISRARINLRDALRGTALASIATSSPDCERALPLIARMQDGQLDEDGAEGTWLSAHMADCDTCRLGREAMEEAGVSYRAWAPIAAGPLLFRETMAEASELVGADWSPVIARHEARRAGMLAGTGAGAEGARASILRHPRRDAVLIGVLACLLVLVVLVGAASDDVPPTAVAPAAQEQPVAEIAETVEEPAEPAKPKKAKKKDEEPAAAPAPAPQDDDPAPTDQAAAAPSEPRAKPERQDSDGQTRVREPRDEEEADGLTPGTVTEPPPPPPPDTTEDPPPSDPPGCVDANGRPCPEPPPPCIPGATNCPQPPRTGPPRLAPPPRQP